MRVRGILKDLLVPLVLLLSLTAIIAATGADISLERLFYHPGSGWAYGDANPWYFLYQFGPFPAVVIAFTALVIFVLSFFFARAYIYRKCALFFLLLALLGPGLLVNTVLKDHWGRPRPRQMQIFGGTRRFHQVWERGEEGKGTSFPSGHASSAFYLIAPYFVLRRSRRKLACLSLAAGMVYGLLMGLARMLQGGHFPSDILWAWGCVYFVALLLYHLLRLDQGALLSPTDPAQ